MNRFGGLQVQVVYREASSYCYLDAEQHILTIQALHLMPNPRMGVGDRFLTVPQPCRSNMCTIL